MLTISLDEQGHFESIAAEEAAGKEPLFIGGVIFNDLDVPGEYEREKQRIYFYLKSVCKQEKASYPQDLHVGGGNHGKVRQVKERISATLSEFLSTGRCHFEDNEYSDELSRMQQREGKYHVFAYMKYGTEQRSMTSDTTSILVREGYASNLYVHMAEEVVERIIFHNPVIEKVDRIHLDLATRRVVLEGENLAQRAREYLSLGYREDLDPAHAQEGRRTFLLTNADIYRTAIEREMMDTGKNKISIDHMGVKSIYYGAESKSYRMEFLYLADIICSMLGFRPDNSSAQNLIEDFKKRADSYTGHQDNLIFAYDEVDTLFKKAWKKLEEKEYFEALKLVCEGGKKNSPYAAYYRSVWFERLRERMKQERDAQAFRIALRKYYMSTRSTDVRQDDLIDMYRIFENMLQNMALQGEDQAVLYDLYDAGTAAFCHIGDSAHAEECFEKCRAYARYVEVERYLRTRNKMVVFLTDYFRFGKAEQIAQENRIFQEELLAVRRLIFDDQEASRNYGIALSQLGQIEASLHKKEGEQIFLEALRQMGNEEAPDYLQTESYLLHYYAEMGEKEKYDERAIRYFGGERNLSNQLKYLIREAARGEKARFSMKFALYVYVKGLYCFHLEDVKDELLDKLCQIEAFIRKIGKEKAYAQINNHPWEIIYKYLALIALAKGRTEAAEDYIEKSAKILTYHGFTLDVICLFGQLEYARASRDQEKSADLTRALLELFREREYEAGELLWEMDEEETYQYLRDEMITYMYV